MQGPDGKGLKNFEVKRQEMPGTRKLYSEKRVQEIECPSSPGFSRRPTFGSETAPDFSE